MSNPTRYQLYGRKLEGHIELTYLDGTLKAVNLHIKDGLTPEVWANILHAHDDSYQAIFPYREDELIDLPLEVKPVQETAVNKKIADFCAAYEKHLHLKYQVAPAESGNLKRNSQVKMTEDLLEVWFTSTEWWAKEKTLGRYIRYYNTLRETTLATKKKYPDYYDRHLEKSLKPSDLQEYWSHLRAIGWAPVKENGRTKTWKPKDKQNA